MQPPKITIFTPTYNRAYTLKKLLDSLIRQEYKSFEWLVIDDGSKDNTKSLFDEWCKEDFGFNIRYIYTTNGGKHRAINQALQIAKGELFFIIDSDDYLTDDSLNKVLLWYNSIKDDNSKKWIGVCGNRGYNPKEIIGTSFEGEYIDTSFLNRYKYGITGDKAEVFITKYISDYKFPEIEGENFIPEGIVWNRMSHDGYVLRHFNEIIYLCEYLEDGLTRNANAITLKNFNGYTLMIKELMQYNYPLMKKVNSLGIYIRLARMKGMRYKDISNNVSINAFSCWIAQILSSLWSKIRKV